MGKYFETDGIRGKFLDVLSIDLVNKIGMASGHVIGSGKTVIIGRDTRESSVIIEDILIKQLVSFGVNVISVGLVSTPMISFELVKSKYDIGIMISASHNPYYDNGIKFFGSNGMKLSDDLEQEIEKYIDEDIDYNSDTIGSIVHKDIVKDYVNYVSSLCPSLEGYKIGLDCANGSASFIAEEIFNKLGASVLAIGNDPDGTNINDNIGSMHPEVLGEFIKENNLDFGFCYDGDADRIIMLDRTGCVLNGDYILYLLGKHFKDNNKLNDNLVIGTVMSNLGLINAFTDIDVDFIATKVGDRFVMQEIYKNNASVGGEQSGHIILPEYIKTGDGMLTSIILSKIITSDMKFFDNLKEELFIYPQILTNIKVSDKKKVMEDKFLLEEIDRLDKELGTSGRILVRCSGTEELVRVMTEIEDKEKCLEINNYLSNLVRNMI